MKNPNVVLTKTGRIIILSKCTVCDNKTLKFIKEQEARILLCKLTVTKVPILSDSNIANIFFWKYKMNAIVNKLLIAGDKFMSERHLRQPEFTWSTCGPFTKNKNGTKKFK